MDELVVKEFDLEEFLKPVCPVKVGDKFYRKYHVPSSLNPIIVKEIKECRDDNGIFYAITGQYENTTIGNPVKVFSSRMITPEDYVIIKKGC